MTGPIVERVLQSARYRDVEPALVQRLAAEELARARNADDAVKRVKRRLHQAVGAFRGAAHHDPLAPVRETWAGDPGDPGFRAACGDLLRTHASTAERVPHLDRFHAGIWTVTGRPGSVLDVGCGLHPVSLPWMALPPDARYIATDVDGRVLATVDAFLDLVGQPRAVRAEDATAGPPGDTVDVAFLLKLVPTLDRQDPAAAARLLVRLHARHAVVSFPARSLGGRGKGMERIYRERIEQLAAEIGVRDVADASVPNELVFVLALRG